MNVSFALFADAANISQEGKLNVLGVFDTVQVGSLPTVHPRATLVVHLKGDRADVGRHSLLLRWVGPGGDVLWATDGEVNVQPPANGATMDVPIIAAVDLPLDQSGTFTMEVLLDDARSAAVPLHVRAPMPPLSPGSLVS